MAREPAKNRENLDRDIEKYTKALEEDPRSRYFAPLADALRRKGEIKAAVEVAEKGIENHPRYLSGLVVAAQAYKDDKQFERALELFHQAARMNPENVAAQKGLAEIYDAMGDHHQAHQAYSALTLLDPFDVKAKERLMLLDATMPRSPLPASKEAKSPPATEPGPKETDSKAAGGANDESSFDSGAEGWKVGEPGQAVPPAEPIEEQEDESPPPLPEDLPVVEPPAQNAPPEMESGQSPDPSPDPSEDQEPKLAPSPLPDDERTTELDAPSEAPPVGEATEEDSGAVVRPPEPPASAGTESRESEDAGENEDPAREADEAPVPTAKGSAPSPGPTEEDKLDMFFASVAPPPSDEESRDEFVVKKAAEALAETRERQLDDYFDTVSEQKQATEEKAAGLNFKITQSEEGEHFWSKGHYNRALMAMAHQLWSNPLNATLREEFSQACQVLERDPESVLDEARDIEERLQGTRVDREQDRGPRRFPASAPSPAPVPETQAETSDDDETDKQPTAGPADLAPAKAKVQALRSYLDKVRKDKEKTP